MRALHAATARMNSFGFQMRLYGGHYVGFDCIENVRQRTAMKQQLDLRNGVTIRHDCHVVE